MLAFLYAFLIGGLVAAVGGGSLQALGHERRRLASVIPEVCGVTSTRG